MVIRQLVFGCSLFAVGTVVGVNYGYYLHLMNKVAQAPPPVQVASSLRRPDASSAGASTVPAVKKGFELIGDGNHGSPRGCNELLFQFFRGTYGDSSRTPQLKVLDVGGGKGNLRKLLGEALNKSPAEVDYRCIDVTESSACEKYGGDRIVSEGEKAYDVVVFNYVLHHAGDSTIGLLEDAKKVARHFVVLQEDLKAVDQHQSHLEHQHEWTGTFRGDVEWKRIFELLGMPVAFEADPPKECAGYYEVLHKLYVLKV
eukprot:gnl/TRDRNA2_/TRDRNA2_195350_c0_seq1.p1 gnl/TRDRNA2_/TRDRNA2_195350_c0~~gnl/TRDRNA2_/TRDRNA2_195350_c0_seq1.p1  ORF type:complete len:257 (-),score=61.94 gnl/TRDRNA2_/TRDRNA2_195350_c0_seq1:86-856(-)